MFRQLSKLLALCLLLHVTIASIETNEVNDHDTTESYLMQGVRVYPNDRHCVMVGGLCLHSSDCIEPTTNKGLCPTSAHLGVECCYEYKRARTQTLCRNQQGQCMDWCGEGVRTTATDCKDGQYCCVLVF